MRARSVQPWFLSLSVDGPRPGMLSVSEDTPEGGGGGGGTNKPEDTPDKPEGDKPDATDDKPEDTGPSAREQALEAELARLRQEAAARQEADEAAAREKAEKDGEWRSLYEKEQERAKAQAERLAALEAKEQARADALRKDNAKRHKALPKALRGLIDLDADPEAVASKISDAEAAATELSARPAGGQGGNGKPQPNTEIPADIVAEAKRRGMDPEAWYQIVQNRKKRKSA